MRIKELDWSALWRELVLTRTLRHSESDSHFSFDREERAKEFDQKSKRKNTRKGDPFLDFIRSDLKAGETILDIGAGTGRWTIPLAKVARSVTAVEPAKAMREILEQNAGEAGASNIEIIQDTWEKARVSAHDITVSAHAMYTSPDFAAFVSKIVESTRRRCYLAMRILPHNGIMAELSENVWGNPYDSPNFLIGYQILYAMGIYANVLAEEGSYHWTNPDLESALERAKRHLHLGTQAEHDGLIRETLKRRLSYKDGVYTWPDGMQSALVWWDIKP